MPVWIRVLLLAAVVWVARGAAAAEPKLNVAPHGTFEAAADGFLGWFPLGVTPNDGAHGIRVIADVAHTGHRALRITPGPAGVVSGTRVSPGPNGDESSAPAEMNGGVRGARTFAMRLDRGLAAVQASAWVHKPDCTHVAVSIVWTTRRNRHPAEEIRRTFVDQPASREDAWNLYEIEAECPAEATRVQLWIEVDGLQPVAIDDVRITLARKPGVRLLVDQVGYAPASTTKSVVLQSSTDFDSLPTVRLIDRDSGQCMFESSWVRCGYLRASDLYHWKADFSRVARPGRYQMELDLKGGTVRSAPFAIGEKLVEDLTAEPAYRFYRYQRCGTAVPGFHAACHLDDARLPDGSLKDLTGGWHDAGDYNKYNGLTPEAVYGLAWAYHRKPHLFDRWDRDENAVADILDEALWGTQFVLKMLDSQSLELLPSVYSGYRYWGPPERETDNRPGTGDERPVRTGKGDASHCVAGFALLGSALRDAGNTDLAQKGHALIDIAERLYDQIGGGIDQLVALHLSTGKERFLAAARARAIRLLASENISGTAFRELAQFVMAFPDDKLCRKIRPLARRRVVQLQSDCDPRFGVYCRRNDRGELLYTGPYQHVNDWYVGETSYRLDAAIDGLLASRLGEPQGRVIAENQVHWLLGCNFFGVSFMEGIGDRFVPSYHHRYNAIPGNSRGAVPGALINGTVRAWPHVDRPWIDLHGEPNADYHCNEPWLLHNNRWLMLIALW